MSKTDNSLKTNNVAGGIILDKTLIDSVDSAEGEAYRRAISHLAWDALSADDKLLLQETAKVVTGDDDKLDAAYFQAVLIVDYVNQHSNRFKIDPLQLLAPAEYRFWS